MRKKFTSFIILVIFLLACELTTPTPEYSDLTDKIEYSILDFPSIQFDHIIWRQDGTLVAIQNERSRQAYAVEGDIDLQYLNLEQDSNCNLITLYDLPTNLPDGRLGLLKMCSTGNTFTDKKYMVAYDWGTGQLEQIVQKPLKHFNISGCFSWNPDMTKGIQAVDSGLVGTLNWLTLIGPEPVHIILREGTRTWDLSKDFEGDGNEEGGTISCPSWSPKGNKIAVFVSFDAIGMKGVTRLDQQYHLVLISPDTGESESILSGIYYPEFIEWSPDGGSIAFVGDLTNELWIFKVETKSLFLIAREGEFDDLSWSPDSKNIAVIWCDKRECEKSEIRQYPIP